MWTVCLRLTRQRHDCDLTLGPSVPESSTLTTRLYRATRRWVTGSILEFESAVTRSQRKIEDLFSSVPVLWTSLYSRMTWQFVDRKAQATVATAVFELTKQRRDCDLTLGPSAPESSTLTTRLVSGFRNHTKTKAVLVLLNQIRPTCDRKYLRMQMAVCFVSAWIFLLWIYWMTCIRLTMIYLKSSRFSRAANHM